MILHEFFSNKGLFADGTQAGAVFVQVHGREMTLGVAQAREAPSANIALASATFQPHDPAPKNCSCTIICNGNLREILTSRCIDFVRAAQMVFEGLFARKDFAASGTRVGRPLARVHQLKVSNGTVPTAQDFPATEALASTADHVYSTISSTIQICKMSSFFSVR